MAKAKKKALKKKVKTVKKILRPVKKKTSAGKSNLKRVKKTSSKIKRKIVAKKKIVKLKKAVKLKKVRSGIKAARRVKIAARIISSQASQPVEKKLRKFKPNKKTRYSKSELKHFRDIILQERKQIFESAKANMDALVDKDSGEYKGDDLTYSSHMAEQGSDEMEREKNYLFVQRDEKYLGYLQEALMRIDQGTYGICIDCKDEPKNLCRTCPLIVKERLELVPITQHCIECKNLRG